MNEGLDALLHEFHVEVHHAAQIPTHDQDRNVKAGLRIRDVKQRFRDLFTSPPQRHGREVTEKMVVMAWSAYYGKRNGREGCSQFEAMRAALLAALGGGDG